MTRHSAEEFFLKDLVAYRDAERTFAQQAIRLEGALLRWIFAHDDAEAAFNYLMEDQEGAKALGAIPAEVLLDVVAMAYTRLYPSEKELA